MSRLAINNAPGNLKVFRLIFLHELSQYSMILTQILHAFLYYLLVITAFHITIGQNKLSNDILIAIHFCAMMLSQLINIRHLFTYDIESGFLDQLKLTGCDNIIIFPAKVLGNCILNICFYLAILPLLFVVWNLDVNLIYFLLSSLIFNLSINFITGLFSLLTNNIKNNEYLIPILSLPLVIPIIIIAIMAISTLNFLFLSFCLMLFFVMVCSYLAIYVI